MTILRFPLLVYQKVIWNAKLPKKCCKSSTKWELKLKELAVSQGGATDVKCSVATRTIFWTYYPLARSLRLYAFLNGREEEKVPSAMQVWDEELPCLEQRVIFPNAFMRLMPTKHPHVIHIPRIGLLPFITSHMHFLSKPLIFQLNKRA